MLPLHEIILEGIPAEDPAETTYAELLHHSVRPVKSFE